MTLKEKLFNTVFDNAWEYRHKNTIPELEKIADEFAIGFAEWYLNLYESDDADTFCKNNMNQLLKIYKQQIK